MKNSNTFKTVLGLLAALLALVQSLGLRAQEASPARYQTIDVNGIGIFYLEAGNLEKPTILPAPDYPGYGKSEQPLISEFDNSFGKVSKLMEVFIEPKGPKTYNPYLMDYRTERQK